MFCLSGVTAAEALYEERLHGHIISVLPGTASPDRGTAQRSRGCCHPLGGLEQLSPAAELDAGPAEPLARGTLELVGRDCDAPSVLLLEPVAHELDRLDLPVTADRDGGTKEEESQRDRFSGRPALCELAQHLEVAPRVRVVLEGSCTGGIELELH